MLTRTDGMPGVSGRVTAGRLFVDGLVGMRLVQGLDVLHWSNGVTWVRQTGSASHAPPSQQSAVSRGVEAARAAGAAAGGEASRGQQGREHAGRWVEVIRHAGSGEYPEGQGYGCWFIRSPGSGLWIDTGSSTRSFRDRAEAYAFFCGKERRRLPVCDVPKRATSTGALFAGRVPLCRLPGCACECRAASHPAKLDAWWPMRAHLLGLTSFEIRRGNKWKSNGAFSTEVVLTSRDCVAQPRPLGPCVPVAVLVGGAGKPQAVCDACDEHLCLGDPADVRTAPTAALRGLKVNWSALPHCSKPSSYFLNCVSSRQQLGAALRPPGAGGGAGGRGAEPARDGHVDGQGAGGGDSAWEGLWPPQRVAIDAFHKHVSLAEGSAELWRQRHEAVLRLLEITETNTRNNSLVF